MKKRVLITNDDGYSAEGLFFLCQSLIKQNYDLTVVAPKIERSGCGPGITISRPLRLQKESLSDPLSSLKCWSIDGTPADCVKLALSTGLCQTPDLILSGINKGSNAGRNLLYSGTVGACIEAAHRGLPAIALSCVGQEDCKFQEASELIPLLIHWLDERPLPKGCLLNVNFPLETPYRGFKLARQGLTYWVENPRIERLHDGEEGYFLGGRCLDCQESEGSDILYLEQGYISLVPIYADELTHLPWLHAHRFSPPELPSKKIS
jgi:5'-nucleotidase